MSIGLLRLDILWLTRVRRASTPHCAWVSGANWVSGVQPQHVGVVVIPQGHHEHHTSVDGLLDGAEPSLVFEVRAILSSCHPIIAEIICDGVVGVAVDSVRWVFNRLAVLRVELLHFHKLAMVSAIVCDELRGHLDRLCAIHLEIRAWAEEVVHAQPVRLDVAAVLVAHALEPVVTVVATVGARTPSLITWGASMHRIG